MVAISRHLVQANMAASEEDKLPDSELLAQMSYVHVTLSEFREIGTQTPSC